VLLLLFCLFLLRKLIGVRNYQIVQKTENGKDKEMQLVEIGPRFALIPIRIFLGSMGGPTLYQNSAFISPNTERSMSKKGKGYVNFSLRYYMVLDC
jgi:ribosome biogenesis protein BRX1